MAEPFGIVAGAIGIAGVFSTCVDCFEFIQLGRQFGKDYQTSVLKLDIARLRLTRWGKAVNINCDPNVQHVMATKKEVDTAKDVLEQILDLFRESERISEKYKPKAKPGELELYNPTNDLEPTVLALHNKMRELAIRRQKGASLKQKTAWALYQMKNFTRLVQDITELVDGLEKIFPVEGRRRQLVEIEITEVQDEPSLAAIKEAAEDVDIVMQETATTAIENLAAGHVFRNIKAEGDAKIRDGDEYSVEALGKMTGAPVSKHVYDGIKAKDRARIHNGNIYGGKSILED